MVYDSPMQTITTKDMKITNSSNEVLRKASLLKLVMVCMSLVDQILPVNVCLCVILSQTIETIIPINHAFS